MHCMYTLQKWKEKKVTGMSILSRKSNHTVIPVVQMHVMCSIMLASLLSYFMKLIFAHNEIAH